MLNADWLTERAHCVALSDADKRAIEQEAESSGITLNKGCQNCYRDAIIQLLIKQKRLENMAKYAVKRGIAFKYKGKVYTSDNLTDEAAEWWIKQDVSRRQYFTELGRDWDWFEGKTATADTAHTSTKRAED